MHSSVNMMSKRLIVILLTGLIIVGSVSAIHLGKPDDPGKGKGKGKGVKAPHPIQFFREFDTDNDTIVLYHFNEENGSIAVDETGMYNGTIYGASFGEGKWGNALMFDGVDDHLDTNIPVNISHDDVFTVEFWFKTPNIDENASMPLFAVGNGSGFFANILGRNHSDYPGLGVEFTDDAGNTVSLGTDESSYDDDEWHYFALTRDAGNLTLYLDGILVDRADNICNDSLSTPDTLWIGARENNNETAFIGSIEEFRISNIIRGVQPIIGLRVRGRAGTTVNMTLEQDGIVENFSVQRIRKEPNSQERVLNISMTRTLNLTFNYTSTKHRGASPVWLLINGHKYKVTTFKAMKKDPETWTQEFNCTIQLA